MQLMRSVERMNECMHESSSPETKEKYEEDCSYGGARSRDIVTWRMLVGTATGWRRLGRPRTRRARRWWPARRCHRAAYDFCGLSIHLTRSALGRLTQLPRSLWPSRNAASQGYRRLSRICAGGPTAPCVRLGYPAIPLPSDQLSTYLTSSVMSRDLPSCIAA